MKVHVFDTYVTIKDREGHPDMDDTLLEKLDEMLTTYGVPHAFSLPHEKTMEDCPEAVLEVAYVGKKTFKVHNALKAGEKVLLIRVQQGKKFVVIDRVKGA